MTKDAEKYFRIISVIEMFLCEDVVLFDNKEIYFITGEIIPYI